MSLPSKLPRPPVTGALDSTIPIDFALNQLGPEYPRNGEISQFLDHVSHLRQLWQDICVLRIGDEDLWASPRASAMTEQKLGGSHRNAAGRLVKKTGYENRRVFPRINSRRQQVVVKILNNRLRDLQPSMIISAATAYISIKSQFRSLLDNGRHGNVLREIRIWWKTRNRIHWMKYTIASLSDYMVVRTWRPAPPTTGSPWRLKRYGTQCPRSSGRICSSCPRSYARGLKVLHKVGLCSIVFECGIQTENSEQFKVQIRKILHSLIRRPQLRRKLKNYILKLRKGKDTERIQRQKHDKLVEEKERLESSLKNKILCLFRSETSAEALSTFTCAACAESVPLRSYCSVTVGDPNFELNVLKRPDLRSDESLLLEQYRPMGDSASDCDSETGDESDSPFLNDLLDPERVDETANAADEILVSVDKTRNLVPVGSQLADYQLRGNDLDKIYHILVDKLDRGDGERFVAAIPTVPTVGDRNFSPVTPTKKGDDAADAAMDLDHSFNK
ncbi:hypothetical protein B0H13DRAFT_1927578 [Mycena leptocephala]|nr:hypothetical protein B0H13DRAFT_1927578 [Mycena leptocephala]